MAIFAHAQQNQVESGHAGRFKVENPAHGMLVSLGGLLKRQGVVQLINLRFGDGDMLKKLLANQLVVAFRVVWRYVALIGKKDMPGRSANRQLRQRRAQNFRQRTARKGHRKASVGGHCCRRNIGHILGGGLSQLLQRGKDVQVERFWRTQRN